MKCILAGIQLLVLMALSVNARADSPEAAAGEQSARRLEATVPISMDYLLYLPKDYEDQESWPLVLFLHGAGERGDDLDLVKKHGPPKLVAGGKEFPFILVSPQCPQDRWWEPVSLTALLDQIVKEYHVDQDRVYVTGLSMGGFGTWSLAGYTPNRFAAIAPICGGGETFSAKALADLPIWVFHGAKDVAVPLERSEKMVEAIQEEGGDPKFTIYPEAGHDSWTETYDNPEFYEWLLKQSRAEKEATES